MIKIIVLPKEYKIQWNFTAFDELVNFLLRHNRTGLHDMNGDYWEHTVKYTSSQMELTTEISPGGDYILNCIYIPLLAKGGIMKNPTLAIIGEIDCMSGIIPKIDPNKLTMKVKDEITEDDKKKIKEQLKCIKTFNKTDESSQFYKDHPGLAEIKRLGELDNGEPMECSTVKTLKYDF